MSLLKNVSSKKPNNNRQLTENEKSESVLDLTHDKARQYFLKQESYCNFDLPEYFKFEKFLSSIDKFLNNKKLSDFYDKNLHPRDLDNVNYKVLNNKDGKYAWRPLQLINPVIYVSLVHKITTKENWMLIQKRFQDFSQINKIECMSIPRQSLTDNSDKAEQISNWWHKIEQRSIEMALDYSYLIHTDLTDCYGAIYTHSVAWALHDKEFAKKNRKKNELIGNQIDSHLQDMSHGQTNGIPQGSSLMDFIAEMVLGYADLELSKCLQEKQITEYKILRYRDDYRIYSQSTSDNNKILKYLTEVMIGLGLKLNADKTNVSSNMIKGSIKSDKLYWIKQKQTEKNLQKHLLIIHDLAMQFPNCGSLSSALKDFYNKLHKRKTLNDSIIPMISILTDIAHKNPRTYQYIAAIISLFLKFENDNSYKKTLLEKVIDKFNDIPNTGHLDIWMQRIALGIKSRVPFNEPLCKLVAEEVVPDIWNFSWIKSKKMNLNISSIIDKSVIKQLSETITKEEIELFKNAFNSDG